MFKISDFGDFALTLHQKFTPNYEKDERTGIQARVFPRLHR